MFHKSMFVVAALAAVSAHAQDLNVTQQVTEETPAVSDDSPATPSPCCGAAIVKGGNFEAEANYSGDGQGRTFAHSSDLTLKYSFTNRIQVQLATANLFTGDATTALRAFDGVSPGLKYVFLDQGDIAPQMAFSAHLVFPTSTDKDALQTTIDAYAMIYASKDVGPIHLDLSASLNLSDLTGQVIPQGQASLVATYNFNDKIGVSTGPNSTFGNADKLPVDGGWMASFNYAPLPQLALSVGAEVGFFPDERQYSVFGGVAWVPTANAKVPLANVTQLPKGEMVASR